MSELTRDEVREILREEGIHPSTVTVEQLKRLRLIIAKHLKDSGIYNGTARLRRARKDLKYIEMQTEMWENREAVSFNDDGFIGVAGWADKRHVKPLLSALVEWAHDYHGFRDEV